MKFSKTLTGSAIVVLAMLNGSMGAQEQDVFSFLEDTGLFGSSVSILDQREKSTQDFELLDENQSGSITLDELEQSSAEDRAEMSMTELRQSMRLRQVIRERFWRPDEETEEFKIVDTNNDGSLSEEEYVERRDAIHEHGVEIGFKELDTDGNGGVELHEFTRYLDELEIYDSDQDGTVTIQEAHASRDSKVMREVLTPVSPLQLLRGNISNSLDEAIENLNKEDDQE